MPIRSFRSSFNAGEMSPLMEGRVDSDKYGSGCRTLKNFIPRVYGGAFRRPGFMYLGDSIDQAEDGRLIPFNFSTTTRLMLEFTDESCSVWGSDGVLITTFDSPYTVAQLDALQYVQLNDVLYVTHPEVAPYKFSRLANDDWTVEAVEFDYPPLLDENTTETTLNVQSSTTAAAGLLVDYYRHDGTATPANITTTGTFHSTFAISTGPFDHGSSTTTPDSATTNYAYVYRGFIYLDTSTSYRFSFAANESGTLKIDGALMATGVNSPYTYRTVSLTAGFHAIEIITVKDNTAAPPSGNVQIQIDVNSAGAQNMTSTTGTGWALYQANTATSTLESSADLFTSDHVGSYWQIRHLRDDLRIKQGITGTTSTSSIRLSGRWEFRTYGTWSGTIYIERAEDNATWETVRVFERDNNANLNISDSEERDAYYRLRLVSCSTTDSAKAYFESIEAKATGLVKITSVTDAREAEVDIISAVTEGEPTKTWSEGAFSDDAGYPRALTFHEQRIIYGGTEREPNMLWGSVTGDFENFRRSTLDDGSFAFRLAATESNPVQWIASQDGLIIGTRAEEWLMESGSEDSPITPTQVQAKRQSRYGSDHIQALVLNDVVVFCQRGGRKFREFVYQFESDGYVAPDLTLLAEHITKSGVRQIAFSQQPDAILWVVLNSGDLIGMTYERDQQVVAWHHHVIDGEVKSVAVLYGDSGETDQVWISIEGANTRALMRMDTEIWQKYDVVYDLESYGTPEDRDEFVFVDCAVVKEFGSPTASITGLPSYLNGFSCTILADGATHPNKTCVSGALTLDYEVSKAVIGLSYESVLYPSRIEIPMDSGSAQARKWRASEVSCRFWLTGSAQAWHEGGEWFDINFRDAGDDMDTPPPLVTGDKRVLTPGSHVDGLNVKIRTSDPQPLNVLALSTKFDVYGS